ncbi:MAG: PAS domain-containing protein [Polyangiaceae bacterium]
MLEAGALLAGATDFRATLGKIVRLVVPSLGDWSVLDLVVDGGALERVVVHHRDPRVQHLADELMLHCREVPACMKSAEEVARSGVSALTVEVPREVLEAAAGDVQHLQLLNALGVDSLARVPLVSHGNVLGVLTLVYTGSARRHGRGTLRVAEELASRCAMALDNALLYERQRAARARSEHLAERLQLATLASGIGIWDYNVSTEVLNWDARTRELFGLSSDAEVSYPRFLERVHPDDRARVDAAVQAALQAGQGGAYDVDYRAFGHAGRIHWLSASGRVVSDTPLRFIGTVLDVTERKQSEAAAALAGDVGVALSESLTLESALTASCRAIFNRLGAHAVAVWTFESETELVLQASSIAPDSSWDVPRQVSLDEEALRSATERRRPLLNASIWFAGTSIPTASVFPLAVEDRAVGVLLVWSEQALPTTSLETLVPLATQLSVGVERFWLEEGSEHQFRLLAETIPNLVWMAEPNGVHDYFNRRWYQYTGYSEDAPVAMQWAESLHPDHRESAERQWRVCYASGQPFQMEYLRRRKDGVYHWFLARAVAVRDSRGRIVKWFGTCTDIDDQKRAEEERKQLLDHARASEEQFRAVVENVPALAWSALPDGYIDFYNRRFYEYTGKDFDEVAGWGWKDLHHPSLLDEAVARWSRCLETGEPFEMEFMLKGADGQFRWFLTRVAPLRSNDGRILRWFGTNTNIDAQKRLQEERNGLIRKLEHKNRELDQFAYVVSHDLKAPLRGISMLSEWIEEEHGDGNYAKLGEHLDLMKKRVSRMEGLINGVLDFSRAGRQTHEHQVVSVSRLINEVCEMVPSGKGVEVDAPADIEISAQRVPLEQVLLNLISNAAKFADESAPLVKVSARREADEIHFVVSDNGPGIDPRHHERIWVIFQTLSGDTEDGTGIGLAIVKKLVEGAGGRVWIDSQLGQGAKFQFTWPVG